MWLASSFTDAWLRGSLTTDVSVALEYRARGEQDEWVESDEFPKSGAGHCSDAAVGWLFRRGIDPVVGS
jgi:hypothetical protein